jgi:hypothetical protein
MGGLFHVVRSLDQAYAMLGVSHDSFVQRLFPESTSNRTDSSEEIVDSGSGSLPSE